MVTGKSAILATEITKRGSLQSPMPPKSGMLHCQSSPPMAESTCHFLLCIESGHSSRRAKINVHPESRDGNCSKARSVSAPLPLSLVARLEESERAEGHS